MPKVVDPLADGFKARLEAGSLVKANPKAKKPVEPETFKLRQVGKGPLSEPSEVSVVVQAAQKPPKAVYVKKNRQELYNHKLELKPFNWFNKKTANATLDEHLQKEKDKGEITDV